MPGSGATRREQRAHMYSFDECTNPLTGHYCNNDVLYDVSDTMV